MRKAPLGLFALLVPLVSTPVVASDALVEVFCWNLGEDDCGAADLAVANERSKPAVGNVKLARVGALRYAKAQGEMGIAFRNAKPDFGVAALQYLESEGMHFVPRDPARTAVHARVKLDAETTTESAVFHIGYESGPGLILETDGAVASGNCWMLHVPGVAYQTGGDTSSAVGDYVDLVVVTNENRLQLYENRKLIIDWNVGNAFGASQRGLRIGASVERGAATRGWNGDIVMFRVLEYSGAFDIEKVLAADDIPVRTSTDATGCRSLSSRALGGALRGS